MQQRHVTHPTGTFGRCDGCKREPKHICSYGTSAREPLRTTHGAGPIERHHLECNPCGRRTAKHPFVDGARREWNVVHAEAQQQARSITAAREPAALRAQR